MKRTQWTVLSAAFWAFGATAAMGAHFVETFASEPGEPGRKPFIWSISTVPVDARTGWSLVDTSLEYRTEN